MLRAFLFLSKAKSNELLDFITVVAIGVLFWAQELSDKMSKKTMVFTW
jgi:hypothetical protein